MRQNRNRKQWQMTIGPGNPAATSFAIVVIGIGCAMIAVAIWIAATDKIGEGQLGPWGPTLVPLAIILIGLAQTLGGAQILLASRMPALAGSLPMVRKGLQVAYFIAFVALMVSTLRS
jgi:hypothetical protein